MWLRRCLFVTILACGASTRDLPSDVSPASSRNGPPIAFLDDAGTGKAKDGGGRSIASTKPKSERTAEDDQNKPCSVRAHATTPNDYVVAKGMLEALRNEVYRGGTPVISQATDAQGQQRGISINVLTPCLEELGFVDGDVLTSVNGVDITNGEAWMRVYESITQQSTANARIERGGSVIELRYRLQL